jgi:hypothetical protein
MLGYAGNILEGGWQDRTAQQCHHVRSNGTPKDQQIVLTDVQGKRIDSRSVCKTRGGEYPCGIPVFGRFMAAG